MNNFPTSKLNHWVSAFGATLIILLVPLSIFSQDDYLNETPTTDLGSKFVVGLNGGVDLPFFLHPQTLQQEYLIGYNAGLQMDYYFSKLGVGLDFNYLLNSPGTFIPQTIDVGGSPWTTVTQRNPVQRLFLGLGPDYRLVNSPSLALELNTRFGATNITGGDLLVTANDRSLGNIAETQQVSTGFQTEFALTGKIQLKASYKLSKTMGLSLGAYYLYHRQVHFDQNLDLGVNNVSGIYYGENVFEVVGEENYILSELPPNVIASAEIDKEFCRDISSAGITLGLNYSFGSAKGPSPVASTGCIDCECPNDSHKLIVTMIDEASQKVIPGADVLVTDMDGNIVASGTTNNFGVVDLGELPHNDYKLEGDVLGIKTATTYINKEEFFPDAILRKQLLYTDLRFILKGVVINKDSRIPESNVLVSLTNNGTRKVEQTTSDGKGGFAFRLEKNSTYGVVGIKQNRLSENGRASTVGLNRSATLFVDLELGIENFECGRGTVLDIKYEFDKDVLLQESKFELDKLVRYMQAHKVSKVELSSHTDSRGPNTYNQDLSQRRAKSAVDYIMSRGVRKSRIIAIGYGETRLTNHCSDGVTCSEEQHQANRRTEAKLICN